MKRNLLKSALLSIVLTLTFSIGFGQSTLDNLATIKQDVKSKRISSYDRSGGNNDRYEHIAPGEKLTLCDIKGAGVINHIWITIAPEAPNLSRSDIIIRMYWDGNEFPSVESPIGPFFGQGWDETYKYISLPLAASPVAGNAMVSYFKMPFKTGARIEIENQADKEISAFYYYVDYVELDKQDKDAGYFHAWYNTEITEAASEGENEWDILDSPPGKNLKGEKNYVFVNTTGKGHYVGVNYFVNCPTPIWYGEGDDMIFIDGSEMPTLHGTGTEDYFNTSWCPNELYSHPYFGLARVPHELGWMGRTHVYRFHIEDPLYFDESFRFTIEHGHYNYLTLQLASVAYWYQNEAVKLAPLPSKQERTLMPITNRVDIHRWRNEWRNSIGSENNPWGNEKIEK